METCNCYDCSGRVKPITHFGCIGVHSGYVDLKKTPEFRDFKHSVEAIGRDKQGSAIAWFASSGVLYITERIYQSLSGGAY